MNTRIDIERIKSVIVVLTLSSLQLCASQTSGAGASATGGVGRSVTQTVLFPGPLQGTLYLSPDGMDTNDCLTLKTACATINHLQNLSSLMAGTTVLLRGGFYFLPGQIQLGAGKGGASGSPITYAAYADEVPILSGAVPVKGWSDVTSDCDGVAITNGLHCWKADLPTGFQDCEYLIYVPSGWPPTYSTYVMSRRSQSMYPQSSYLRNVGTTSDYDILVTSSDISALTTDPHNAHDIKFYNFPNSNVDALRIDTLTAQSNGQTDITLCPGNSPDLPCGTLRSGTRYVIVNSREYFLMQQTPGTFYIECGDTTSCINQQKNSGSITGSIYYIAKPGENLQTDMILAPQIDPSSPSILVDNNGSSGGADFVTFRGLVFIGDNYVTPITSYTSATGQPFIPAAVSFVDTQNIIVDSVRIAHTSGWGLEFTNDSCTTPFPAPNCPVNGSSVSNALVNSAIYDVGTSGLRLGRFPPNNSDGGNTDDQATQFTTVRNNLFLGTGRMYPGGEAGCVWIGSSHDNLVSHNDCADSYGGGIAIGVKTGVTTDYVYNNAIEVNNFHDLGEGVIDDFGCVHIANLGGFNFSGVGNTFQNNICHDITHNIEDDFQGGIGIYIDANSQGNLMQYNLVYRASGALLFGNTGPQCPGPPDHDPTPGCRNTVSNNIFAYSYEGPIERGGDPNTGIGDDLLDFTFKHNVVLFDKGMGPQWLNENGMGAWDCDTHNNVLPAAPCTDFFAFYSNGYWSPKLVFPSFVTNNDSDDTMSTWIGLGPWQLSNGHMAPAEDRQNPPEPGVGAYIDPGFVGPNYASDDYRFSTSSEVPNIIGFDTNAFEATYSAGRSNPIISAPPLAPGFPLELIPPLDF